MNILENPYPVVALAGLAGAVLYAVCRRLPADGVRPEARWLLTGLLGYMVLRCVEVVIQGT